MVMAQVMEMLLKCDDDSNWALLVMLMEGESLIVV